MSMCCSPAELKLETSADCSPALILIQERTDPICLACMMVNAVLEGGTSPWRRCATYLSFPLFAWGGSLGPQELLQQK